LASEAPASRKNILNLACLCETHGLQECAACWHRVIAMNDCQKKRFSEKMVSSMFNTVTGKKIAVLGYAFKKDTGDVRETPSMFVVRVLVLEEARIHVYDPQVSREDMWTEMKCTCGMSVDTHPGLEAAVTTSPDPYAACEGAHALAVLTEWDEFKGLDYARIYKSMAKPAFVFDGRNVLDHDGLRELGFEVHAIGKPDPNKFSDL